MLHGIVFYTALFILLTNSGASLGYGIAIYVGVWALDLTSYIMGFNRGVDSGYKEGYGDGQFDLEMK